MSLPTMHRFTCKLLSVVCGECTKFKHINKHFNFQIVCSLYSWSCLPLCPCQTWGDLFPPPCPPPLYFPPLKKCADTEIDSSASPRVFCGTSRSCWPLQREEESQGKGKNSPWLRRIYLVRDRLGNLIAHKPVGPDAMLRELAEVMAKLLLKGHGEKERCLRAGGKLVWLQSSERARRRSWETAGWSASSLSLGK